MQTITFNLKNHYNAANLDGVAGWDLFKALRSIFHTCPGAVSSPQFNSEGQVTQPRVNRDLWDAQRANKPVTVEYATRRGYTAISFTF